jgi:uncharacterized protein YcfJ
MNTRHLLIIGGMVAAILPGSSAWADRLHHAEVESFTDTARVTHVDPVYRTVTTTYPERECWEEEVYYSADDNHRDNTARNMIIGGVLGGALGHNIGRHSDSAKIAGAVIGSAIGYDASQRHHGKRKFRRGAEERCHTVYENSSRERLDGYRVTYRYHGQTFTTRMDHDPGDRIRLRVRLTPLD